MSSPMPPKSKPCILSIRMVIMPKYLLNAEYAHYFELRIKHEFHALQLLFSNKTQFNRVQCISIHTKPA